MRRRTFLRSAASAAGLFQIVPRRVLGGDGGTPPSRKINLAAIGCGGQAGHDLKQMAGENIVALCDVDDRRAAEAFTAHPQARRFKDFRRMFDEAGDSIDAVLVGTPDHTHAVAAMAAMRRGKHVFCEKPLAHSVAEVRAMRKEAADRKVITQMGNQGHSTESIRVFCEWIRAGAIGDVTEVHCGCDHFPAVYCQTEKLEAVRRETPPVPEGLDWDLWLGPVERRPYHPAYVPWSWRGWSAFGSGAIGDWVCHVVDPVFWALDLDMPVSIQAETEGYDPEKHAELYPAGSRITYEFPAQGKRGPVKLVWHDGKIPIPRPEELEADRKVVGTGAVVIGRNGKIMYGSHGAGGCRLIPESQMKAFKMPDKTIPRVKNGHHRDWLDAIREGRSAGADFDYGARLSEIGLLGMIAIRMGGMKLTYDGDAMRFANSEAANRLLGPPLRPGWTL
ncbi:MAG: Gfo/Idh/MocA family oxidoreductase [Verrucomicrobia bacterium]|nr:Gfo/Idh/MocA family oxidoreductase [Verrucomicrobiota bacterium]